MTGTGPVGKPRSQIEAGTAASPCKPNPAERAERLLVEWRTIRSSHAPTPVGCSCGHPVAHVSAADFEIDLIDFVAAQWAGKKLDSATAAILDKGGQRLEGLLVAIGESKAGPDAHALLDDIETALLSFAAPRRPSSGAGEPEPGD